MSNDIYNTKTIERQELGLNVVLFEAESITEFISLNREALEQMSVIEARIFPDMEKILTNPRVAKSLDFCDFSTDEIADEARRIALDLLGHGYAFPAVAKFLGYLKTADKWLSAKYPECTSLYGIPDEVLNKINRFNSDFIKRSDVNQIQTVLYKAVFATKEIYEGKHYCWTEKEMMSRDIWLIDCLDTTFTDSKALHIDTFSFSGISQGWLKDMIKKVSAIRITTHSRQTVAGDIICIGLLSECIRLMKDKVTCFEDMTVEAGTKIINYIRGRFQNPATANGRINGIINVLEFYERTHMINCRPSEAFALFTPAKKVRKLPEIYSGEEIIRIREAAKNIPVQEMRALYIQSATGTRISDILNLEKDSMVLENGVYSFYLRQPKTQNPTIVPIEDPLVPVMFEAACADSCPDSNMAFTDKFGRVFSYQQIYYDINQELKKQNALGDDGRPLKVKTHKFRKTVGTRLAAIFKDDPAMVSKLLGQTDVRSLPHYILYPDVKFAEDIKDVIAESEARIQSIGKKPEIKTIVPEKEIISGTPLLDGWCEKPSGCEKYGTCYQCHMFAAVSQFLPFYRDYRDRANVELEYAKKHGHTIEAEKYRSLKENLDRIIIGIEAQKGI